MRKFFTLSALLLALMPQLVMSVPAKPTPILRYLPNGDSITVFLRGDEHNHLYLSEDGYPLILGADEFLYYAKTTPDGLLTSSNIKATQVNRRLPAESSYLQTINKQEILNTYIQRTQQQPSRYRQFSKNKVAIPYPTTGNVKALVILVEYADVNFSISQPHTSYQEMMTQKGYDKNGAIGSARDYFTSNSSNLFMPDFNVFGPVKLANPRSYYGANDYAGNDMHPEQMVIEACRLLDNQINFSEYDLDNDGYVDNVYVFYAGYGEADGGSANTVWPHSWKIYDGAHITAIFDNVKLNSYACSNELTYGSNLEMDGIGTFCHEYSHVLGLPDFYATSYTTAFTPNSWELMDAGSYNGDGKVPPHMSVYSRYALNWMQPTEITAANRSYTLPPIVDNESFIIKTTDPSEYFLLENRQQTKWDTYIPGHGMLIWHIDYDQYQWDRNTVNNNAAHQYIDIEEADAKPNESTRSGDAFPGTAVVTSFTDNTYPNMRMWNGTSLNKPISAITETNGMITFRVGSQTTLPDPPVISPATEISATAFTANWQPVTDATGYEFTAYQKDPQNLKRRMYLPGYKNITVATNSILVENLSSMSTYYYNVRTIRNNDISNESTEMEVQTGSGGFYDTPIVALEATNVASNSFDANWQLPDNTHEVTTFILNVQEYSIRPSTPVICDFTNRLSDLPSGWNTNATSTYAMEGYYGNASPSVRFAEDATQLTTNTTTDPIASLNFWYRGQGCSEETKLLIYAHDGSEWLKLDSITDLHTGNPNTFTLPKLTKNYYKIQLLFVRPAKGTIAIDDIALSTASMTKIDLDEYKDRSIAPDKNTFHITNLTPATTYSYQLKAYNGTVYSQLSNEIQVKTAAVETALQPLPYRHEIITSPQGIILHQAQETTYRVYSLVGTLLKTGKFKGETEIALSKGIYIVYIGKSVYKIVVP